MTRRLRHQITSGIQSWLPGRSFRRQFSSLSAANLAVAATSLAATVALARVLTVEDFGRVVFAQATAQVVVILMDPRLEDALVRYVPQLSQTEQPGAPTALFRRLLSLDAGLGIAFVVIAGIILLSGSLPLRGVADPELIFLAIAHMGAQASYGTIAAAFGVTDGYSRFGGLDVLRTLSITGAGLGGLFAGGGPGYLAATAATAAVGTIVVGRIAWQRMNDRFGSSSHVRLLDTPGFVSFTWKSSLASSLTVGTEQLPLSVIGAVAGPQTLAAFRVAVTPGRLVVGGFGPASGIMFPAFARDIAAGHPDLVRAKARRWSLGAAPFAVAGGLLAWLTLPYVLPFVFGPPFEDAVAAATLLVIAALIRGTVIWSKVVALAVGRPGVRIGVIATESLALFATTWHLAPEGVSSIAAAHLVIAACASLVWWVLLDYLVAHSEDTSAG